MDLKQGLYTLDAKTIYREAKKLFHTFFAEQTPLNAFKLSITLYHLLEWIVPGSNGGELLKRLKNREDSSLNSQEKLVVELRNDRFYEVLRSIADSSKHCSLTRSSAYDKEIIKGFRVGRSVVGERLGQDNLVVNFDSQEVWLREVFAYVLSKYAEYFGDLEGIYPTER